MDQCSVYKAVVSRMIIPSSASAPAPPTRSRGAEKG